MRKPWQKTALLCGIAVTFGLGLAGCQKEPIAKGPPPEKLDERQIALYVEGMT